MPAMARAVRPATSETGVHLEQVLLCLQVARHHARLAGCPATLRKLQSALKSADGAKRHLARRLASSTAPIALPEEGEPSTAEPEQSPFFGLSTRTALVSLETVADAFGDMIDLADAWATSGPEGYTRSERKRRDRAERVLRWLRQRIESARVPA
jgi:hypothetical protein